MYKKSMFLRWKLGLYRYPAIVERLEEGTFALEQTGA
jgi:hypothetical protein